MDNIAIYKITISSIRKIYQNYIQVSSLLEVYLMFASLILIQILSELSLHLYSVTFPLVIAINDRLYKHKNNIYINHIHMIL